MNNINETILNKEYRNDLRKNPHKLTHLSKDIEVIVKTNTKNKFYLVLNKNQGEFDLENINAAVQTSTISSLGSASTIATGGSTVGTIGCISTGGSIKV